MIPGTKGVARGVAEEAGDWSFAPGGRDAIYARGQGGKGIPTQPTIEMQGMYRARRKRRDQSRLDCIAAGIVRLQQGFHRDGRSRPKPKSNLQKIKAEFDARMALLGCREIALGMVTTARSHDVKMHGR